MTTKELNHIAREKLVGEISRRMQVAQIVTRRDIDFAVDYAEKAMIQAQGFSLKDAESNLDQVAEWFGYAVSQLLSDIKRIGDLKKLTREIRESEGS